MWDEIFSESFSEKINVKLAKYHEILHQYWQLYVTITLMKNNVTTAKQL